MRLLKLSIFIFAFSLNSFSQDTTYYDSKWEVTVKSNAKYYRTLQEDGELWQIKDYFIDHQLQMEGYLNEPVATARHGNFIWYRKDGTISQTGSYNNGNRDGELKWFYTNGSVESFENYKNGIGHGPFGSYHPNGNIKSKGNYVNDVLHGLVDFYHENGKISYKGEFKNGKKVGNWIYGDEDGNITERNYQISFSFSDCQLNFEAPNNWYFFEQKDYTGMKVYTFRREPILNSEGLSIIPNISFLVEDVEELNDVVMYSAGKRLKTNFSIDSVLTHEDGYFKFKNAIGFIGKYIDKEREHSVHILYGINNKKGIQVIMDMTSDIYPEYQHEFYEAMKLIDVYPTN